ncbi:hypothetical protein OD769_27640, partial [Pseudomonas aeruginosa]|nr:hypothetical protein [Pseudomonas aeruginosa]MCV4356089.1 hypothetical protein [Pseudomonas aeruginosa]MCV6499168.1 hypothetical protein [Pseudomonas aeruginosa]
SLYDQLRRPPAAAVTLTPVTQNSAHPRYLTAQEAQRDISHYLMHRYNWIRPHQFNDGLPPAVAEEKLNPLSGMG